MRQSMIIFIIFSLPGCASFISGVGVGLAFNRDHPSKYFNEIVKSNVELLKEQEKATKN